MNTVLWDKTEGLRHVFIYRAYDLIILWLFFGKWLQFFIAESKKEMNNITICYIMTWIFFFPSNTNNNGFAPEFQVLSAHHYITKLGTHAPVSYKLTSLSSTAVYSVRPKVFRCSSFVFFVFVIVWGVSGTKETSLLKTPPLLWGFSDFILISFFTLNLISIIFFKFTASIASIM